MKKEYIQPYVEVEGVEGERLCQLLQPTGVGNQEPETGDNHFPAPWRY